MKLTLLTATIVFLTFLTGDHIDDLTNTANIEATESLQGHSMVQRYSGSNEVGLQCSNDGANFYFH